MKKNKKFKVGILIIELVFTLLYFSIQFDSMNLSIKDGTIGKRDITLTLSDGTSVSFEWDRTWGGVDSEWSEGVAVDSSNNVYISGYTYSFGVGEGDMILVKYDGNGMQQWNRTWGGANFEGSFGVTVDSSDNIYLGGYTLSFGAGERDMILVKYDGNGMQQWNCTWGGGDDDIGNGVAVDGFDNVYLAGYTRSFGAGESDMILVKYNGDGIQQWNCTWGGANRDYGKGVAVDGFDNVYLAGYTYSFGAGESKMILVKYNGDGIQQWNCTWGGSIGDAGYGVAVDSVDNVFLAGKTYSFGAGLCDMVLVKYDGNGIQKWNRTWGEDGEDYGHGVAVDSLDNVYLAGETRSFGVGDGLMALIKYDGNGVQQWNCTWGGESHDAGYGVAVDSSDNVYLIGSTSSFGAGSYDMVLVKYSYIERPSADDLTLIPIIIVSIATLVGVGIVITYFIRKRRKTVV